MAEYNDNIINWLENQFDGNQANEDTSDWPLTKLLWAYSHKKYERPQYAVDSILAGENKKEAAFALFWFSYNISIEDEREINLDTLLNAFKQESLSGAQNPISDHNESAKNYFTDIVKFRNESTITNLFISSKENEDAYVMALLSAGRILLNFHKYTANNEPVIYSKSLVSLIKSSYEIISKGLPEVENYSAKNQSFSIEPVSEGLYGFTGCIASTIITASYAQMYLSQNEFEKAFITLTEAFQYLKQEEYRWEMVLQLVNSPNIGLFKSLWIYDQLMKNPGLVSDWKYLYRQFEEWDNTLYHLGIEEELYLAEEVGSGEPYDWYFPTQIKMLQIQANHNNFQTNVKTLIEKQVQDEIKDEIKKRLERFFFKDTWHFVPVEAQERLALMELNWDQRTNSIHMSLNHLQRATEIMLRDLLAKILNSPPIKNGQSQEVKSITTYIKSLLENPKEIPGLYDLSTLFRGRDIIVLADNFTDIISYELRFLVDQARIDKLHILRVQRGQVEYQKGDVTYNEVMELINMALGIGRRGILPAVAIICKKLSEL